MYLDKDSIKSYKFYVQKLVSKVNLQNRAGIATEEANDKPQALANALNNAIVGLPLRQGFRQNWQHLLHCFCVRQFSYWRFQESKYRRDTIYFLITQKLFFSNLEKDSASKDSILKTLKTQNLKSFLTEKLEKVNFEKHKN